MRKAWDDAYSMFIKSVSIKPDYTDGLINLFDATLKLHRVNDMAPLLEKALSMNPHEEEFKNPSRSNFKKKATVFIPLSAVFTLEGKSADRRGPRPVRGGQIESCHGKNTSKSTMKKALPQKCFPVLDHILLSAAVFRRIFPFYGSNQA